MGAENVNEHQYDDIISLPHHVSTTRKQMSIHDRAAQFAPFAALSGYDDALDETGRLTADRIEQEEDSHVLLDEKLQYIKSRLKDSPEVTITYFKPDDKKNGGSYVTVDGAVRRIDEHENRIILRDGKQIDIIQIIALEGEVFGTLDV